MGNIFNIIQKSGQIILSTVVFIFLFTCLAPCVSALVSEFVPSLYVAEDYTDNYFQTEQDKVYEFYTTYGVDLSFGLFQKTGQIVMNYNPEFKDYEKQNEEDSLEHNASVAGEFKPSERASLNLNLNYDGHGDNNQRESWEHEALFDATYELSKYTGSQFSAGYTNSYERQLRTREWNESKDYTFSGGIAHQFGKNDSVGFDYTYSLTDFVGPNSDDYKEHNPSVFLAYWFTPQFGFDSNLSYEYTYYNFSKNNTESWTGDFRFIRTITKQLQVYAKYEHSYTKEEEGDNTVYTPSVGFDWSVTEDSGVSLGVGYMIQEWENGEENGGLFVDADVFKTFNFSKHGTFTISAASGYEATSNEAASLGFQVYYQAGFMLSYQFLKNLSAQLIGSYTRDQFDDPEVNRVDDTIDFGAGLTWEPWKKVNIDLLYTFEDYSSDDETLENYQENKGTIMVTFYPANLPRMLPSTTRRARENESTTGSNTRSSEQERNITSDVDRAEIEDKIFNNRQIK